MNALTLNQEFGLMRLRFRRTLAVSVGVHALLLAALLLSNRPAPLDDAIVEITWLDQELPPQPRPVTPEPKTIETIVTKPTPAATGPVQSVPELTVKEKLARLGDHADRVRHQLSELPPTTVASKAASALPAKSAALLNTARATMAPITRRQAPANLNRGSGAHQPAVALTRGPTSSHRTAAVVAELPRQGTSTAAARPQDGAAGSRHLGGATLSGLVADRHVLEHPMPTYPAWAMSQAVEATVTLSLRVLPSGLVKPNVQIQKTAGFADFDHNASEAIRQWRFEPLTGPDAREQWGTITFRYRLND